ncbi:peptidoglycan DD-metalloendopeptidase family protein [Curtobacterium sp. MCPF17_002]|uniref:M23 family metallopeptidase n=1 Tax=Curtobacterium sp. MCPF17_002 TaxID=2175645 RepID=UPI000DAA61B3|nr:M23 family metallopeptidase [Curtobacterium sp. MCPF17_002]WIB76499.1 peptidoglycan DD-metalloendopeptidase family protein [Curtobacterium sp. MCPF17_002]
MPHSSLSPVQTDGPGNDPTPVVHLTRRARIEAERAAAATVAGGDRAERATVVAEPTGASRQSFEDLVSPVTPPAPASPIDFAPASPAMPASTAAPVTPPAPSSPIVASSAPSTSAPATRATPDAAQSPSAPATRRVLGQVPASRRPGRTVRAGGSATAHVDRATRHLGAGRPKAVAAPAVAPARKQGASFRRAASRVTAVGALLFAAGLVVSTSLPAQAFYTPETGSTSARSTAAGATQSLSVGSGATDAETNRDQYSVSSATQYKNVDSSSFTNDPNGTIQWPFLTGVPITSGFGGRQVEGCSFCSTNHMGVDFAPGEGTPIRVIAGGTVIKVQANDGGFGNDVWVQHDVDGKQFVSVYGHMEDNSFKVVTGQQVAVGDELGLVGSTGNSTGPHLHLEVHVDGVPVDPLAWLEANAN